MEIALGDEGADTRASLLARVRDPGDHDAWQEFFEIYAPLIMRWCRKGGLNQQDAEDVTQNVLRSVASAIRIFEYEPQKGMFRSWLFTAVRREIARYVKQDKQLGKRILNDPTPLLDSLQTEQSPVGDWEDELVAYVYQVAVERVRPEFDQRQWKVFQMLWDEGRSAPEVASEFGKSVGWVYKVKFNVKERLRAEALFIAEDLPMFT